MTAASSTVSTATTTAGAVAAVEADDDLVLAGDSVGDGRHELVSDDDAERHVRRWPAPRGGDRHDRSRRMRRRRHPRTPRRPPPYRPAGAGRSSASGIDHDHSVELAIPGRGRRLSGGRELAVESGSHRQRIARHGDHAEALLSADRGERSGGVDAGHHTVSLTGVDDRRQRVVEDRVAVVAVRFEPEADDEVGGTDVDRVDPGDGQDLVEVRRSPRPSRSWGSRRRLGGPRPVVVVAHAGHHRPPAASAFGRVPGGAHDRLGLRRGC